MTDQIRITGLEVYAHHGVLAEEKEIGQPFLIDLTLHTDLRDAGSSDKLDSTVDYGEISKRVHDLVAESRFDLIEKVAHEVAESVLSDNRVNSVEVTVHKPQAPIAVPFSDVSVTIRRP